MAHLLNVSTSLSMAKILLDYCKGINEDINIYLNDDNWIELDMAIRNLAEDPNIRSNNDILGVIFGKTNVPKRHWKALEGGESRCSLSILRVIEIITQHGNNESIFKYFSENNGILFLEKCFKSKLSSEMEHKYCLSILVSLLSKTESLPYAKLTVPVAARFKDMVEEEKMGFKVMLQGVTLIDFLCYCQGSEDLMSDVFKSGMVSFVVKILSKCQEVKQEEPLKSIFDVWTSVCTMIGAVLKKDTVKLKFDKVDLPILILNVVEIVRETAIGLKEYETYKLKALDNAVQDLVLLIYETKNVSDLTAIKEYGVIKKVVNALVVILQLQDDELKRHSHGLVRNSIKIIVWMMDVEPSVRVVAPAVSTILKSINENPMSYSSSDRFLVASFCYKAVEKGSREDLKHLLNQGLISILASLPDQLDNEIKLFKFFSVLYDMILKVPDTDEFLHFDKGFFDTLFANYQSYICCDVPNCEHKEQVTKTGETLEQKLVFVVAALGISCKFTDDARFKSLDNHFYCNFQEIQEGKVAIELPYPGSFMIIKMAKVNCFKSSVLPHIWYIVEHGPDELIKDLFEALPQAEERAKVVNQEEMKEQVMKYVLVEIKDVFERKSKYKRSMIIRLTEFLTSIPCNEQGDTVLYHLEDLVSPCLGLLEDQNNKRIIENVKKFINILHYS